MLKIIRKENTAVMTFTTFDNKVRKLKFYDYILKEFITTAKRVAPEAVSGCVGMYSYYYTNDVYSDYPLPYEEIAITKMEKIENLDEVVKDTVIKL